MPKVNLVPKEEKAREFRRRVYIFPIAGAVILVAALGGSYIYYGSQVDNAQSEYDNAKSNNDALAKQLAELQKYQDAKNQKDAKQNDVKAIYDQRIRWSRILDDLSFVIPQNIWLVSLDGSISGKPVTACGGGSKTNSGCAQLSPDILIDGYTYDMPTVATFMIRLGLLPSLTNVTLASADSEKLGDKIVIHFKIGVNLKPPNEVQDTSTAPASGNYTPPPSSTSTMPTPTGATPSAGRTITTPTSSSGSGTLGGGITP